MGFNQVSDETYEKIMIRENDPKLEEWREIKKQQPIFHEKVYKAKEELNKLMMESSSLSYKKRKIEEVLYLDNKDVL